MTTKCRTRLAAMSWHRCDEGAAEAWLLERPDAKYALFFSPQPPLLIGDLDRAGHRLAMALQQFPNEPLITSLQGILHARRDETDAAVECVRRALELPRSFGHTHHTYDQIACVHAVLGETDRAMAWLERSVDTGFACWPFFRVDPHLENLHEELEFKRLVAGLEQKYTALKIQGAPRPLECDKPRRSESARQRVLPVQASAHSADQCEKPERQRSNDCASDDPVDSGPEHRAIVNPPDSQ